jgi:leader peptidase (prepilin peptidase)/N-methyltransferase
MRWAVAGAAAGCGAMMLRFGFTALLPALCYLAVVAAPLTVIDIREHRLPDRLTLPSYPISVALLALPNGRDRLLSALVGLAVALAVYLALALVYPAGIGWGDVKLSGVLGLYLGWFGARAFVAGLAGGFVLAAVAGLALIAAGRATRKTQVPFGPFMLGGAMAAVLIFG